MLNKLAYKNETIHIFYRIDPVFAVVCICRQNKALEKTAFRTALECTVEVKTTFTFLTYLVLSIQEKIGRANKTIVMNCYNNRYFPFT